MRAMLLAAAFAVTLAGCATSFDERWNAMTPPRELPAIKGDRLRSEPPRPACRPIRCVIATA